MVNSIVQCERALSLLPPSEYFSERIRMYRAASVAILSTVSVHLEPPVSGVADTPSLLRHVEGGSVSFDSKVFVDEPFADLDLSHGIPLAHFLGLIGASSALDKVLQPESNQSQTGDSKGNTILHYACMGGHADLALRLCQVHGLNPAIPNHSGTLPLHWLVMFTRAEMEKAIATLADQGDGPWPAPLGATSSGILLPIHFASLRGSALHWAVSCGNKAAVELLIRAGSDPNLEHNAYTPLALAVELLLVEIVELLLQSGARTHCIGPFGRSAFHFLAGNAPIIKKRIVHGAEGYRRAVKRVLDKLLYFGADIDARDKFGNTPLMKAVASPFERGREDDLVVLQELLLYGASRNAQNKDGDSAFHVAILKSWSDQPNHTIVFTMLLDETLSLADEEMEVMMKDRHGRTAYKLAAYFKSDLVKLLQKFILESREALFDELLSNEVDVAEFSYNRFLEMVSFEAAELARLRNIGLGVENNQDCS